MVIGELQYPVDATYPSSIYLSHCSAQYACIKDLVKMTQLSLKKNIVVIYDNGLRKQNVSSWELLSLYTLLYASSNSQATQHIRHETLGEEAQVNPSHDSEVIADQSLNTLTTSEYVTTWVVQLEAS